MAKVCKFDSGLMLLYENNTINKSTSIDINFDCGSRCDGALPGLSHFCEHMFFSGTNKLSKQEVTKRYFDFMKTNAYTGVEQIVFTGVIASNKLKNYLETVQDMIYNSTFTKQAVEDEKKIVIQEIVRDADKHSNHAYYKKMYELYGMDYFKYGVLGNKETVNKITNKDVKNYVKKYFVKNNCIISICSDLSFGKVKNIVKKYFDNIMPSNNLKPLPYKQDKLLDIEKVGLYNKDIDKNFVSLIFKFNKKGPDVKYKTTLGMISNMIDDISEGLTKELRIENSLIYGMGSDYMINYVNSGFELYTEICSENIKPCLDIVFNYINNIRKNGFTKQQFKKELEKDDYYCQTRIDTPTSINRNLTRYRFYGKFISDKDIHKQMHSLTLDEVNQTMRELFDNAKIQLFVYGNATKKDLYTIKQLQKKFN